MQSTLEDFIEEIVKQMNEWMKTPEQKRKQYKQQRVEKYMAFEIKLTYAIESRCFLWI